MASKKSKRSLLLVLFAMAAAAIYWFKFRKFTDKFGNVFTRESDGVVSINGSTANGGSVSSLVKYKDGTVGGTNGSGTYYWDNAKWIMAPGKV